MRASRLGRLAASLAVVCGAAPVVEAGPARANAVPLGAVQLSVQAAGTLPTFPCNGICSGSFSGSLLPLGAAHTLSFDDCCLADPVWEFIGVVPNVQQYELAFALLGGPARGSVSYNEPGAPVCPGLGSATFSAVMSSPALGVARRLSPPGLGTVDSVTFNVGGWWQRAGAGAAMVVAGDVSVTVTFPEGQRTLRRSVLGSGSGAFVVDPKETIERCLSPGPLTFQAIAHANLAFF